MSTRSLLGYTYCVLRYHHDPATGEALNVGVVVLGTDTPYLSVRFDEHYERLSRAFAGFEGEQYGRVRARLQLLIHQLQRQIAEGLPLVNRPRDAGAAVRRIWSDPDLSFQAGEVLAGLTDDLARETDIIYERMVTSRYARPKKFSRTDDEVWSLYQRSLAIRSIARVLSPRQFSADNYSFEFDHTFKNGRWHILQPLSFDLVQADAIQAKAARWLGTGVALEKHPDLGKMYLLLGSPKSGGNQRAYDRAKSLLDRMPIPHELIEEKDAEAFAGELQSYAHAQGIVESQHHD